MWKPLTFASRDTNRWNIRYAGKKAGRIEKAGYAVVSLDGTMYKAHRLIYKLVEGAEPPQFLDHKNGVRADNRWDNIRSASHSGNAANCLLRKDNSSGYKGVCWNKRQKKWVAQIGLEGTRKHIGVFDQPEEVRSLLA